MSPARRTRSRRSVLAGATALGGALLAPVSGATALFSASGTETGRVSAGVWVDDRVVFTRGGSLESVVAGEPVREHGPVGVSVVGPRTSLLGDAYAIPFHGDSGRATGELQYVDDGGSVTVLETGATTVRTRGSRLATGVWNGGPASVFYASADGEVIYRVAPGETAPTEVLRPGNGATAVLGTADLDGDGTTELAYVDGSRAVRYVRPDGDAGREIASVGANDTVGAGIPASFPDTGLRVPIVDGSNRIALVAEDGTSAELTASGAARMTAVAATDVDDDGRREITFVDADGELAYVDDVGGVPTVEPLTDDASDPVSGVDTERGVV